MTILRRPGWDARQIGTIMSIQGIALMVYQPIFFPPLTRWLGGE